MELRRPEGEELAALTEALGEDAPKLQRGVAAVPLTSLSASLSAFANDVDPELVFAQLTYALGKKEDVLICLSTSGNSKNVVKAAKVAKALGIKTIGMSGEGGGAFLSICDVTINAPSRETYKVQEYHLPIYHAICAEVERILFVK
jgi:phosphoheptose isomerase